MSQIFRAFHSGTLTNNPLTAGATTATSSAFASLPVVTTPDTLFLVFDPEGAIGTPEIVKVTAHTAAATSVTIVRGQQTAKGGGAAREHPAGTVWAHASTPDDYDQLPFRLVTVKGDLVVATGPNTVDRLAAGTNGKLLRTNSATASGLEWVSENYVIAAVRADVTSPHEGLVVYETTTNKTVRWNGTAWRGTQPESFGAIGIAGEYTDNAWHYGLQYTLTSRGVPGQLHVHSHLMTTQTTALATPFTVEHALVIDNISEVEHRALYGASTTSSMSTTAYHPGTGSTQIDVLYKLVGSGESIAAYLDARFNRVSVLFVPDSD